MSAALRRFSWRQLSTRPARVLLTLVSITIGVAAIAAVEMIAVSSQGASQQMFATVAGNSALVIKSPGERPFDEALVEQVEAVEGVAVAVPLLQENISLFTGEKGESVKTRGVVLGVDPERDRKLRDHELAAGRFAQEGDEVVLEQDFATSRDVKVGDEVRMLGGSIHSTPLTVVGLLRNASFSRASSGGMVFLPLTTAQRLFLRGKHQVSAVQVMAKPGTNEVALAKRINAMLPQGISAEPPAMRTAVMEQTLIPMEQGLQVARVFIALLAAFIVFNTFMMNVSERRRQLAIMRAIGGTKAQLFGLLISEALLLAAIGTVIGIVAGWQGAVGLTRNLGNVLEVDLPVAQLTVRIIVEAIVFGLLISLLGALYPAWHASRLTPLEAMSPIITDKADRLNFWPIVVAVVIIVLSIGMLFLTMEEYLPVTWGVYPALGVLLALVILAETLLLVPVSELVSGAIRPALGMPATLAHRQVVRHQTRSALTSGVIFIAAATGVGLSWEILDTVNNIRNWYNKTINGDFYVRVALPDFSTGESPETPQEFDDRLKQVNHVESIDRGRIVKATINGEKAMVGAREYPTDVQASFDFVEFDGDPKTVRQRLLDGDMLVSSVVALPAKLHAGDYATLETPSGPQKVKVAGVTNEYIAGGLVCWMHRSTAEKLLNITGYDGYIIMAQPGQEKELRAELEPLTKEYGLILQSFVDIRHKVDGIIGASDKLLWLLVFLEFVVATFGMVNTLAMSVLEQTRELGMLRIIAMTRTQVRRTIFSQAIIIGVMGIVPGIAAGVVFAYIMNLATAGSISHVVAFGFHPWLMVLVSTMFLLLVVGGAMIPAVRASRINVLKALQYE